MDCCLTEILLVQDVAAQILQWLDFASYRSLFGASRAIQAEFAKTRHRKERLVIRERLLKNLLHNYKCPRNSAGHLIGRKELNFVADQSVKFDCVRLEGYNWTNGEQTWLYYNVFTRRSDKKWILIVQGGVVLNRLKKLFRLEKARHAFQTDLARVHFCVEEKTFSGGSTIECNEWQLLGYKATYEDFSRRTPSWKYLPGLVDPKTFRFDFLHAIRKLCLKHGKSIEFWQLPSVQQLAAKYAEFDLEDERFRAVHL